MRSLKGCQPFAMCCISARFALVLYLKSTSSLDSARRSPSALFSTTAPLIGLPSRSTPRRRFWQSQQRPSRRVLTVGMNSSVQVLHLRRDASICLICSCSPHSSSRRRPVAFSHSSASRSAFMKAGSSPPRISSHHRQIPSSSSSSPSKTTAQSAHGLAASLVFGSCSVIMVPSSFRAGSTLGR